MDLAAQSLGIWNCIWRSIASPYCLRRPAPTVESPATESAREMGAVAERRSLSSWEDGNSSDDEDVEKVNGADHETEPIDGDISGDSTSCYFSG